MALEVARRLIDGIWGTSVEDSGDTGGGSSALPWTQFESVAGDPITAGQVGIIAFAPSAFGSGTLDTVTAGLSPDNDPAILFEDPGQYLLAMDVQAVAGFANLVDPARLEFEIQVFNSEYDPYLLLDVRRPEDPFALGVLSAVIGIYEDDVAPFGFALPLRARSTDFTPANNLCFLKVIKLA